MTTKINGGGSLFLTEKASADADVAGDGQVWVKTATPNTLYFTDDAGTDFEIASAATNALVPISTQTASSDATITFTGLDTTYDLLVFQLIDIVPSTDGALFHMRVGDSSGIDSGASDYYQWMNPEDGAASSGGTYSLMTITNASEGVGSATGEALSGYVYFYMGDQTKRPMFRSESAYTNGTPVTRGSNGCHARAAVITSDRLQFFFASGNVATGKFNLYGVKNP